MRYGTIATKIKIPTNNYNRSSGNNKIIAIIEVVVVVAVVVEVVHIEAVPIVIDVVSEVFVVAKVSPSIVYWIEIEFLHLCF